MFILEANVKLGVQTFSAAPCRSGFQLGVFYFTHSSTLG